MFEIAVRNIMKEPEDFTVRVNFRPHQNVAAPVEQSLHWGRIITCLLILMLIIAMIMMLTRQFFSEPSPQAVVSTELLSTSILEANQDTRTTENSFIEQKQNEVEVLTIEPQTNQQSIEGNLVAEANKVPQLNTELTALTGNNTNQRLDSAQNQSTDSDLTADIEITETKNTGLEGNSAKSIVTELETDSNNVTSSIDLTNQVSNSAIQEMAEQTTFTDVDTHASNVNATNSVSSDFTSVEETQASEIERNQPTVIDNETDINQQHLFAEHITLPPSTPLIQGSVQRLSENINRFQITPMVEDHEPLGTINDIEAENGVLTVYAFSEANNLKDTVLYYVWNLNGRDVATVPIAIGADRWRSHSTKFIEPSMKGQWTVKLQNAQGETLAINQFTYEQ